MNFLFNAEDIRGYWLTRLLLERGIGIICLIAFLNALNQFRPLLGERGLLPVPLFIKQVAFRESPSLFFFLPRDWAFTAAASLGILLSCLVITGIASRYTWLSILTWLSIYLLYLSFVNFLCVRLGINPARSQLFRHFSGCRKRGAASDSHLALSLAHVPHYVRSRIN